ncbi:metal ABC transporter substrate-binding protein [Actinotalea sp. K2]|uniref:metal ABC transporter substrate-binding protein n=1 Tax=Actinotalea sp. K2 TaxID=2939438 RepID=UPI002017E864|nr:metal ABC transporter substrate-binding protein [Actinotalea sp. K2]MCL3860609.1 metal ABC transporter substrate-binding protein [Actinotalea sp. K2]
MSIPRRYPLLALLAAGALTLSACGSTPEASGGQAPQSPAQDTEAVEQDTLEVLASFYPLEYVVQQVGGDLVSVSSMTPEGADPHDLELSPRQVRTVSEADVVVYLSGFQAAVDEAIVSREPEHLLDTAQAARLVPYTGGGDLHDHDHGDDEHAEDEHGHEGEEHAEDEHGHEGEEHAEEEVAEEEHAADGEVLDPHFWLDVERLAAVGHEVARVLGAAAPEHAQTFLDRADALEADLSSLDQEFAEGLAQCERGIVVTPHAAFGYLLDRFGLQHVGIAGIDPETEPSPARLREIGDVVREHGVTTIYAESAVNPQVTQILARDLGVDTGVLDPIETLAEDMTDYREVMESNLAALRAGLGCA